MNNPQAIGGRGNQRSLGWQGQRDACFAVPLRGLATPLGRKSHIPPNYVVKHVPTHRKPPEVRI